MSPSTNISIIITKLTEVKILDRKIAYLILTAERCELHKERKQNELQNIIQNYLTINFVPFNVLLVSYQSNFQYVMLQSI
jgi:hypothetical protein